MSDHRGSLPLQYRLPTPHRSRYPMAWLAVLWTPPQNSQPRHGIPGTVTVRAVYRLAAVNGSEPQRGGCQTT
ncbi:hypothetical protein [Escherichia coli]|uniref:hypothetical protein n=1 Tax=Escherichia coli TaxID=562 RepID=UPI004069230B